MPESPERNYDDMREKYLKSDKKEKIWIPNTFEWSKPCISIQEIPRNQARDTKV